MVQYSTVQYSIVQHSTVPEEHDGPPRPPARPQPRPQHPSNLHHLRRAGVRVQGAETPRVSENINCFRSVMSEDGVA